MRMPSRPYRPLVALLLLTGCAAATAAEWVDAPLSPETWWEQGAEWKTATYDIPLASGMALEHMLRLNAGDMIVYHWTVAMDEPEQLTAEFHGHTDQSGDEPGTVMFYTQHKNGNESGSLRAPFTGVHGWYLNNESEQDIVVRLSVAGYFTEE
jgi:hypothetical protein